MADPTTTRATIRQKVIKKLYKGRYPVVGVTTSLALDSVSIVDSKLAPSGQIEDHKGAWVQVGTEIARVTNVDYDGDSKLIVAPAFASPIASATTYEMHYKFDPTAINDIIAEILENVRYEKYMPLSLLTSTEGATSGWTGTNATVAENTATTAGIPSGASSLKVTLTSANGYASQNVLIDPHTTVIVSSNVYVTVGDVARMSIWDNTNGVELSYAETDKTGLAELSFVTTTPATCYEVQVRLGGVGNGDVIYYDDIGLIDVNENGSISLPTSLEWPEDFDGLYYYPTGPVLSTTLSHNAYRFKYHALERWGDTTPENDSRGLRAGKQVSNDGMPLHRPLFVRGRVDFELPTADTDSIYAREDYVVDLVLAELWDALADIDEGNNNHDGATKKAEKAEKIREKLSVIARFASPNRGVVTGAFERK